MLGSRFAVLMLFTRVFKEWVLGVIGESECQGFISQFIKFDKQRVEHIYCCSVRVHPYHLYGLLVISLNMYVYGHMKC